MKSRLNKKISLTIIASILVIVVGFSLTTQKYFINAETQTTHDDYSGSTPVGKQHSGIPFLVAYPLAIQPAQYHKLSIGDNGWIGKLVEKGEISINENEIKDFFSIISDNNSYFGVTIGGTTKFYQIDYVEAPISLDKPNVKAYRLEVVPDNYIPVNLQSHSWFKKAADNEFRWMQIDTASAIALKQLSNNKNFNFQVTYEDGHKEFYNIRYAGPELDTLGGP